jgi:predicted PurR-regulated permease PerM
MLQKTPENIDQALLSPDVQSQLKQLQKDGATFKKRERELQKEVTREFRRKLATYRFGNTLVVPVLVILFGIGLAIFRRRSIAAR